MYIIFFLCKNKHYICNMEKRNNITKKIIVKNMSKNLGIDEYDIRAVLDSFTSEVSKHLSNGDPVVIRGLGSFNIIEVKARSGNDLFRGKVVTIPARKKVTFTPAIKIKNSLQGKE